jgi:hypothetical protein
MAETQGFHETFERAGDVKAGSERAFGTVLAAAFLLIALWPLLDGANPRLWALALAALLLAAAALAPGALTPLNRIWFRFGMLLHRIASPLVMALLFFLTVTPTALILRLAGKDPLRLKFDPALKSYWIEREPGPAPETMRRQF